LITLISTCQQQHLDTSCGNNRVLSQNQLTRGGFEMARVAALDHSCAYAFDEIRFIVVKILGYISRLQTSAFVGGSKTKVAPVELTLTNCLILVTHQHCPVAEGSSCQVPSKKPFCL